MLVTALLLSFSLNTTSPDLAAVPGTLAMTPTAALPGELQKLLDEPGLRGSATALHVVRLRDGHVIYSQRPDELLVPASTIKLFTTATALATLGPDFRFKTDIYGPEPVNGVIEDDIRLKGYGDPWLVPEKLWYLANRLKYKGVEEIRGNIMVDESYFEGTLIAAGSEQDTSSSAYMAPSGALSVGFNAILVHILASDTAGKPAKLRVEPESDYSVIHGEVETVSQGRSSISVEVEPGDHQSIIKVSGRISQSDRARAYWRRIHHSGIHTGSAFKHMLETMGIRVTGKVLIAPASTPPIGPPPAPESASSTAEASTEEPTTASPEESTAPLTAEPLVSMNSPRLADIIEKVNKYSNNFMAAQVARVVGAEVTQSAGTWGKAESAILAFLKDEVKVTGPTPTIKNASGLHDVNRVTARQVCELLGYMQNQPRMRTEFRNSLAVAGGTGTLETRMHEGTANLLLRGKTGTLSIASALSGYATTRDGDELCFAMITNHFQNGIQAVWDIQNAVGELLTSVTDSADKNARSSTESSSPQDTATP
jgi:D-alanyl-D-alanine carboxypeptidase/D-alanyl-D-alanine-endopeptidase (penicillin-binding protein 4)